MVGLAVLFTLLCLPLLLSNRESNYTWDETSYHLPAVRQIREHWPKLDVEKDSLSATAPGYHYFLASISLATGTGRPALRLVNLAVSFGVVVLLCRSWPAGCGPWPAFFSILPLAASNFVIKSASYVVTDNAALLFSTGTLLSLFLIPSKRGPRAASVLAAAGVFVRQISIWLVAPLAVRLLAEPRPVRRLPLVLPACLTLAWLFLSWRGVVPPIWRDLTHASQGLVPAAGAYLLAVLAILGPFYYLVASRPTWRADAFNRWSIAGASVGIILAVAGPNTPDHDSGRWGGYLWELAARLPNLGDYSPVFLVLAPMGGVVLTMLARRLWTEVGPNAGAVWLISFLAWMSTTMTNRQVFHRYYEPTLLLLLICWLLLLVRSRPAGSLLNIKPLAMLGVFQLLVTLVTAHARTFGFL